MSKAIEWLLEADKQGAVGRIEELLEAEAA
jgi:hypothetical protein